MRYLMTIKRLEKNEDYDREVECFKERNRYNAPSYDIPPNQEKEIIALEVILTEAEFIAAKKAIIETIK